MGIITEWDQTCSITFRNEKNISLHLPAPISFLCVWSGIYHDNLPLSFISYKI